MVFIWALSSNSFTFLNHFDSSLAVGQVCSVVINHLGFLDVVDNMSYDLVNSIDFAPRLDSNIQSCI